MTKEQLRKELECGKTLKELFEFTDGQECLIYKANDFEVSDNIVYIPDVDMNEIDVETVFTTDSEIENALNNCYTGNDFMEECKGCEDLAKELFWFVDWQHPNIQDDLDTYDDGDEFEDKFGFSMENFLNGNKQFKVEVKETYTRTVTVFAEDEYEAHNYVEELVNDGYIDIPNDGGDYDYSRDLDVSEVD